MRRVGIPLAAAVLVLSAGCRSGGEPAATTATAAPDGWQALAERLAPLVWLAPDEEYGPADASQFIRDSTLRFDHGRVCKDDDPIATEVDAVRLGKGGYTHEAAARPHPQSEDPLPCNHDSTKVFESHATVDEGPDGGHGFSLDLDDSAREGDGTGSPVHWQYVPGQGGRAAIVYWLFYAYNDFKNDHEGDWERVAVQLDGDRPTGMVLWAHENPACVLPWDSIEKSEGHPVTYAAKGSHGSYPRAGRFGSAFVDSTGRGEEWETWRQVRQTERQPWWGYRGIWGMPGPRWFSGIAGPSRDRDLGPATTTARCAPEPRPSGVGTAPPTAARTPAGAIERFERFLHALGREDLRVACEIAGPAAKKAQEEGWGPCETTFPIMFAMYSTAEKAALRTATVDPALVVVRGPGEVEVPARAVRSAVTFTARDLGDSVLTWLRGDWFITD